MRGRIRRRTKNVREAQTNCATWPRGCAVGATGSKSTARKILPRGETNDLRTRRHHQHETPVVGKRPSRSAASNRQSQRGRVITNMRAILIDPEKRTITEL